MKHRGKLFIILIIGAGVGGYFYSGSVYRFYMRYYYQNIQKKSERDMVARARILFDKKQYPQLAIEMKTMALVYPDNREIKQIEALTLIKTGETKRGVDILLSMVDTEKIPGEVLEDVIMTMFNERLYHDIIYVLQRNPPGNNPNILYYLGVSHYQKKQWAAAIATMSRAIKEGRTDARAHFMLGQAYVQGGDAAKALVHLEEAYRYNDRDPETAEALVHVYRKLGKTGEAEKIIRRRE